MNNKTIPINIFEEGAAAGLIPIPKL